MGAAQEKGREEEEEEEEKGGETKNTKTYSKSRILRHRHDGSEWE